MTTATLDRALPTYHARAAYSRTIPAGVDEVWAALTALTVGDLAVTRVLVAVRFLGRPLPSPSTPMLTAGPLTALEISPPAYALGGGIGRPWQARPQRRQPGTLAGFRGFDEPGWVKYATDFRLTAEPDGTRLSTETRAYCTDDRSRRRFGVYWLLIRAGSGLIRRDILAAVDRVARDRAPGAGAS